MYIGRKHVRTYIGCKHATVRTPLALITPHGSMAPIHADVYQPPHAPMPVSRTRPLCRRSTHARISAVARKDARHVAPVTEHGARRKSLSQRDLYYHRITTTLKRRGESKCGSGCPCGALPPLFKRRRPAPPLSLGQERPSPLRQGRRCCRRRKCSWRPRASLPARLASASTGGN